MAMVTLASSGRWGRRAAVASVRRGLVIRLRLAGYGRDQARRLVAAQSDGTIWDRLKQFWATWGPTILKVILALLPLLLAAEKPEGLPLAAIPGDELQALEQEFDDYAAAEPSIRLRMSSAHPGSDPGPGGDIEGDEDDADELTDTPIENPGDDVPDDGGPCDDRGCEDVDSFRRRARNKMRSGAFFLIKYQHTDYDDVRHLGPFSTRAAADQASIGLINSHGGKIENLLIAMGTLDEIRVMKEAFRVYDSF